MYKRQVDVNPSQRNVVWVEQAIAVVIDENTPGNRIWCIPVSYTHLRAHETVLDLVCRILLEQKKPQQTNYNN